MKLPRNLFRLLLICGVLTELFYILFVLFAKDRNIPLYMIIYFGSFIVFFFAYFVLLKKQNSGSDEKNAQKSLFLIIAFGMIFRLTLLPASYSTSDDVHRYLWEGKVLVNGYNAFTTPPNDSSLIHLRDENFERVTFQNMSAIYPPFSQIVFAVNYLIAGNSTIFLKVIYLIFEFITLIYILKLLVLKRRNTKLILLYAWLPLPIMEYFINAHLDVIGITFLILFVYYFAKQKYHTASILLAIAFLSKLFALLLLPLVIKKVGFKKALNFYAIFILVCLIFYLPFISQNPDILAGLFKYLAHWEFNGSIYNLIKFIFSRGDIARMVCVVLLSISVLIISFRYKDFVNGVFAVFLCIVIFSTTLYPWYLGWVAALNVFAGFYSVLSLFFTINVSNFTPLAEKWKEYPIVWIIEYVPFYGLLFYDLWKRKVGYHHKVNA